MADDPIAIDGGTTPVFGAVIEDEDGVRIPGSALASLKLTLVDVLSGAVINDRNGQNVLASTSFGITVDSSGNLEWQLSVADSAILHQELGEERHHILFEFQYGAGGVLVGKYRGCFLVRNVERVW